MMERPALEEALREVSQKWAREKARVRELEQKLRQARLNFGRILLDAWKRLDQV